jgi:hypothetical protein
MAIFLYRSGSLTVEKMVGTYSITGRSSKTVYCCSYLYHLLNPRKSFDAPFLFIYWTTWTTCTLSLTIFCSKNSKSQFFVCGPLRMFQFFVCGLVRMLLHCESISHKNDSKHFFHGKSSNIPLDVSLVFVRLF